MPMKAANRVEPSPL